MADVRRVQGQVLIGRNVETASADHSTLRKRRREPVRLRIAKAGYLFAAGLLMCLALAGVIVPGLPTTPFVLLASFCLVRSSPALNARLLNSSLFGPILRDWQERGGVRRDVKIKAATCVSLVVILTLCLSQSILRSAIVCGLAAIGLMVIARVPVVKKHNAGNSDQGSDMSPFAR